MEALRGPLSASLRAWHPHTRIASEALQGTATGLCEVLQQATHYCEECGQPVEPPDSPIHYGTLTLTGRTLTHFGRQVRLRPQFAVVLGALMKRGIVSTEGLRMLLDREGDGVTKNLVNVQVCKLRQRLRAANMPLEIKTVWGRGYALEAAERPGG